MDTSVTSVKKATTRFIGITAAIIIAFASLVISRVITYEYTNPKLFTIEIGLSIIIALILFLYSFSSWKKAFFQPVVWGIGLFLLTVMFSTFTSIDSVTSWFGNIDRGTGMFFLLILGIATVALGVALDKKSARNFILVPIVISGVLLSLSISAGELGWKILATASRGGFMGNTSVAGTYLIMGLFISLYLCITSPTIRARIFYILAIAVMLINTIFINFSFHFSQGLFSALGEAQGASLSLLFGLLVAGGFWLATSQKNIKKIIGISLLCITLALTIVGIVQLAQPQTTLHAWFVSKETDVRFIYWNIAMQGFKAHPVLGSGPETYAYTHQAFFNPITMLKTHSGEVWSNKPHNMYLQVLSETGLIGMIGYIALFAGLIWSIWRGYRLNKDRVFVVVAMGLLAAYLLNNLILFDTVTSYFVLFMLFAYVIASAPIKESASKPQPWDVSIRYILGLAGIAIVLFIVIPQIEKTHRAYKEFILPLDQRATYYQKVENTASYGSALFVSQRADFSYESIFAPNLREILAQNAGNQKLAADAIQGLIDTVQNSFKKYPKNEQGELAIAKLASIKMVILNAPDQNTLLTMKSAAQEAIMFAPHNPNGYLILGQEYIYEQKYDDAYATFEKARNLEPALAQAQFALVNLANLLHDQKRLVAYVTRAKQESPDFAAAVQ